MTEKQLMRLGQIAIYGVIFSPVIALAITHGFVGVLTFAWVLPLTMVMGALSVSGGSYLS